MHFSKQQRKTVITLLLVAAQIEAMKEDGTLRTWFDAAGSKWLKQSSTLVVKAFREHLAPKLSERDALLLHKEIVESEIVIQKQAKHEKHLSLPLQVVYTMAEKAIGNTCCGCTIEAYRRCELFRALCEADIPPAHQTNVGCPYRQ